MLVDPSPDRMARLHRHFPEAVCVDDMERAFPRPGTDLALVASPPSFHRRHVLTALSFGCDVLCEKPLAIAPADVVEMSRAAERHARILMVGMTRRFFPSLATAASLLRRVRRGKESSLAVWKAVFINGPLRWTLRSGARRGRRSLGGQGSACVGFVALAFRTDDGGGMPGGRHDRRGGGQLPPGSLRARLSGPCS